MNTEQVARELRRLTDDRDAGRMTFTDYRQRRAELLDQLAGFAPRPDADSTRPRQNERRPAAAPSAPAATAKTKTKAAAPAPASGQAARRPGSLLVIGGAVAVLALAGGIWLWRGQSHPADRASDAATASEGPAVGDAVGPSPVDAFLARGDWSDAAISTLNTAWWRLSDSEILATLTSDGAKRLSDEVATRLRVRGTRGGPPPLDPDAPLILLARNLNVPVPPTAIGPRTAAAEAAPVAAKPAAGKVAPPPPAPVAAARAPAAGAPAPARAPTAPASAPAPAAAPVAASADAARAGSGAPDPCANAKRRRCHDDLAAGRPGPDLIVLPPGHFRMGSTLTPEEQPVHDVAVLRPFALTRSEVTVGQWRAFCEASGRGGCGAGGADELPVVNVTWKDASDYAKWLSDQTGRHYRLPSEAEWEYAARADTVGEPGHELPALNPNTDARYAAPGGPHPAGPTTVDDPTFRANGFGLLHLLGNVREWVQDPWTADYQHAGADVAAREGGGSARVVRGGSYRDGPERVRPGARDHLEATAKDAQTGFRLVRELRAQ